MDGDGGFINTNIRRYFLLGTNTDAIHVHAVQ